MVYTPFFDRFPKVNYDINRSKVNPKYEALTDIFIRIGVIREVLNNAASYYIYLVEDGDTPEILAEKVYEDPGAAWMIIYANKILDPQFDWPLDYDSFQRFIIDKYGSVANAKTGIHHYEKVITRTVDTGPDEIVTETRFTVNQDKLTDNSLDVPYDYYENLPETQAVETYNVGDRAITEVIKRDAISYYDYENQLNEDRKKIKVIKNTYYPRVQTEFKKLVDFKEPFLRRLV